MISLFDNLPKSIDASFAAFDAAHPEVYALFVEYAEQVKARGFTRYSADAICHRIRWWHVVEQGQADFKINNNITSRYARKLMAERPEFEGFFETRMLRSVAC